LGLGADGEEMKPAALAICCLALAACANSSVAAVVPKPPSLGAPVVERTVSTKTLNGYTVRATVRVYRPTHANAIPKLPFERQRSLSCPTVGATDGVVPVAFELTNASLAVRTGLGIAMAIEPDLPVNISRVKYDATTGDKSTCIVSTPEKGAQYLRLWESAHRSGAGERAGFFIVLPHYFAAPHPDGDRAFLKNASLFVFLYANGRAKGLHAFRNTAPPEEWFVRLARR
jgi:hypothetical protein